MPNRDELTFSQAEGLEPIPSPLRRGELPQALRTDIYNILLLSLRECRDRDELFGTWQSVMIEKHLKYDHRPLDEMNLTYSSACHQLREIIFTEPYNKVFDFLQFVARLEDGPKDVIGRLDYAFEEQQIAYRWVDTTIMPVSTEQETATLTKAFADLDAEEFGGARSHLRAAGEALSVGKAGDSVRESIHAVESVVRALTGKPKATLSDGLALLKESAPLHPAFEAGLQKLYAYTNDEQGIRHALISEGASVDEADALFMLGACASFVSYLIGKTRLHHPT